MSLELSSHETIEAMAGAAAAGMMVGALAMRAYVKGPLSDEGHRIFVSPSFEAAQAVVEVLDTNGLAAHRSITDEKTSQILMKDNVTTINVVRPDLAQSMDDPHSAITLRSKDPDAAAGAAKVALERQGFSADIVHLFNPEEPREGDTTGNITFVVTNALRHGAIGFRPHVAKMGKMPPRYRKGQQLHFTGEHE